MNASYLIEISARDLAMITEALDYQADTAYQPPQRAEERRTLAQQLRDQAARLEAKGLA